MPEIVQFFTGLQAVAGSLGTDGDLAPEGTDLVSVFRDECRTRHIKGDVVLHHHVALVVDESPSGAVDHDAAGHERW